MKLSDMKKKLNTNSSLIHLILMGCLRLAKAVLLNVALLSTLLRLTSFPSCSSYYDSCGSYCTNPNDGVDHDPPFELPTSLVDRSHDNVCANSRMFCFPSTISSFSSSEHNTEEAVSDALPAISFHPLRMRWYNSSIWSADYGMKESSDGRRISCSLDLKDSLQEDPSFLNPISSGISSRGGKLVYPKGIGYGNSKSDKIEPGYSEDISSVSIEINPPMLDWGQNYLYSPSVASLTVTNTHNENILHVYDTFSTDIQFYPCESGDVLLGPGEAASICFVFLPRQLGLSSAHLILQTNSGGFVIRVKGFATNSPYGIQPFGGPDISSSGKWSKNLSLFNPFDEVLFVEEVTTWLSISIGNSLYTANTTCTVENKVGYDEVTRDRDGLDTRSGRPNWMRIRPHTKWDIDPHSTEPLIEMDLSFDNEGNVFGVYCMQLLRDSQEKRDIVMVPIEFELDGKAVNNEFGSLVTVSIEPLGTCDYSETITASISLRNHAQSILRIVKITEVPDMKLFQIKYVEGLILFPNSVTQVAVASYNRSPRHAVDLNCKLFLVTNESSNSQIEIPCQDILSICSSHLNSSVDEGESSNARTGSLRSGGQVPSRTKVLETAEADELVLKNWKSQGTSTDTSVLDDLEVLFPMVQVGAHLSKWITVKNPSQLPVVMQLVLNSGEVIDECKGPNGFMYATSSSNFVREGTTSPSRYGFSIAENALTEAYVQPHGTTSFGPILFHPSKRCCWKSSALIRNNFTGVEWVSLRGFGGSLSLVLLEDSEPVESLEFKFDLPMSLNKSPLNILNQMQNTTYTCSRQLSKEVYAKNSGDFPLDVRRIGVSGKECRLDGFFVHSCKSFSLEPGESAKLLISYQTDFSGANVHRDLELALATGILVIPMKASLPLYVVNFCQRSMFWMRVRKSTIFILFAASVYLVFGYIFPHVMAWGSHDYLFKGEKSSIATISSSRKISRTHRNQSNDKFPVYAKNDDLMMSAGSDASFLRSSPDEGNVDANAVTPDFAIISHHAKYSGERNHFLDAQMEKSLPCSLLSKSEAVEKSDLLDASQSGNLTVKIGKDKGRRRRRRKGANAGLTSLFDVSSSQSGNSTPSSPLSPFTSLTPNRVSMFSADVDHHIKARDPFTQVTHQHCEKLIVPEATSTAKIVDHEGAEKDFNKSWSSSAHDHPVVPKKTASKVLFPSATFPCSERRAPSIMCPSDSIVPSSSIAPHARAPGPKLFNPKSVPPKEKAVHVVDEFAYDIWADHFCGLDLTAALTPRKTENGSDGFFVRGSRTLVEESQLISDLVQVEDDVANSEIYETVRLEVRRAISDIQHDLETILEERR